MKYNNEVDYPLFDYLQTNVRVESAELKWFRKRLDFIGNNQKDSEAELMMLPGIGRYTARAICSQAFGQPSAVLDTNVARILERFFGIEGGRVKSRCKILWSQAEEIAPDTEVGSWNLTLLDFGAIICTARNPQCPQCPLSPRCHWFNLFF